jgi:hypothetical protein
MELKNIIEKEKDEWDGVDYIFFTQTKIGI